MSSSQFHPSTYDSSSARVGHSPLIFSNMIQEWEAAHWTPSHLAALAADTKFNCRLHCRHCFQKNGKIQWEGDCYHVMSSVAGFMSWIQGRAIDGDEDSGLSSFDPKLFWCYLDYTSLDNVVKEKAVISKAIDWSCFGLVEEEPFHNYVWLGSQGAHTPCHYDTYGFNLVVQLYGSKRWILFPPEDSENLYPTRIPYEESSVYSDVNIKNPDFVKHPKFKNSRPHVIVLKPGQVLYIPWKWWHFAECLDTSLSINSWLQLPEDNAARVEEAIARMIFCKWMTFTKNTDHWLNPNEDVESDEINAAYLSQTLYSLNKMSPSSTKDSDPKSTASSSKMSSSFDSKRSHLDNFLIWLEKIVKRYPLQMVGSQSSPVEQGCSSSNSQVTDDQMKQQTHYFMPATNTDFMQDSTDSSRIKKQRLANVSEWLSNTDAQPVIQQLSPCPVDKMSMHLGHSENQHQAPCPFHPKRAKSPEVPQPGPLHGEFVEEELLKNLLKPDVVTLLAQKLTKRYTQEQNEQLTNN